MFIQNNKKSELWETGSFAAEELTELANDWLSDSEDFEEGGTEITKEAFAKRIGISEMTISPD